MTEPFCMPCVEATFDREAIEAVDRSVACAPPFRPEQREALCRLFATARARRKPDLPPPLKPCGHA